MWTEAASLRAPQERPILVVEPDEEVARYLVRVLAREGFTSVVASSGNLALEGWNGADPCAVLVDFEVPDPGGGPAVCRRLRARWDTPLIVVARSGSEMGALASFEAGADDYVHRVSRQNELGARVRAALRRWPTRAFMPSRVIAVGDVELDPERHVVRVSGKPVALPLREFRLLEVLLSSPGKTWTRAALMRRVWGETPASGTKTLDVHVKRIRMRIEDDPTAPTRILTVRGVGYRYASS